MVGVAGSNPAVPTKKGTDISTFFYYYALLIKCKYYPMTRSNPDKPKCFCGIFGIFGTPDAALHTYYGLHALQHRGQEASGIITRDVSSDRKTVFNVLKGEGLVSEVFDQYSDWGKLLTGDAAIGHNRYSTTGASHSRKNIQPFTVHYRDGNLAVAHNGNLTNESELRRQLVHEGAIFQTTTDSEVILHLIARSRKEDQIEQIKEALHQIQGAYSLLIMTDDKLIATRDPNGFRPLAIAKYKDAFVVASETCAFDILPAEYIRDVAPGEIVIIDRDAIESGTPKVDTLYPPHEINKKHCIFEYIYFSRPDSKIFGHNVDKIRRRLGKVLANKYPVFPEGDDKVVVISVPDSSNTVALGYAQTLLKNGVKAKYEIGLIRSHYIGRTFIEPEQDRREMGVRIKFNTVRGVLEGKTVVVVDDSIVRGTTSMLLVKLLREANPKSIHMRISSPPILYPCYYGMDFPSHTELIANKMNRDISAIKDYIGLDSLEYLSIDELLSVMHDDNPVNYCTACFSGNYPLPVNESFNKEMYE